MPLSTWLLSAVSCQLAAASAWHHREAGVAAARPQARLRHAGFTRMDVVPLRSPETYAFEYRADPADDEHL